MLSQAFYTVNDKVVACKSKLLPHSYNYVRVFRMKTAKPKNYYIRVRLTKEERDTLESKAKRLGLTMSSLVIHAIKKIKAPSA